MPTVLSGQRIARSFVTPTGAANEVSRVLNFNLAADEGIRIFGVQGYGSFHDDTPATSDTVPNTVVAHQGLHLESGATEDLDDAAGEDDDQIDTELFYIQWFQQTFHVPATAGGGGGYGTVTPNGIWVPPEPIDSARNITHKGTTLNADTDLESGVLIYYKYVKFNRDELLGILARR